MSEEEILNPDQIANFVANQPLNLSKEGKENLRNTIRDFARDYADFHHQKEMDRKLSGLEEEMNVFFGHLELASDYRNERRAHRMTGAKWLSEKLREQ